MTKLFGQMPASGILPRQPSWSSVGDKAAYLRDSFDAAGRVHTELWFHDAVSGVDNPVFTGKGNNVSSYTWCGPSRLIAAAGGDLFAIGTDAAAVQLTHTKQEEKNPVASPDGARVAFVRDNDLFVLDLLSKKETRLTQGGSLHRVYGEAAWLYVEEFDTAAGMGWSPDNRKLWFYDTDLSQVPFRDIPQADGTSVKMPYPRPGEANPVVRIAAVDLNTDPPSVSYLDTGSDPDQYLPRVSWQEDSRRLLVTRIDRLQTNLEIMVCPISGGPCSAAVSERDPRFLDLLADPLILPGGREMLFLSERSGFSQIYRVGLDGTGLRAVTEGRWTVIRINAVDPSAKIVIFTAAVEDPSEYRLYRIPLDGGDIEELDTAQGCHDALFSADGTRYLDTHSALNRPPRTDIRTVDGKLLATLAAQDVSSYHAEGVVSDLFPIETKNGTLNALLTRPSVVQEGKRYPVMVIVYGGPHAQLAKDWFHPTYQPFRDLLARRGVMVFTIDGRGSEGLGHDFETSVRLTLGRLELEDQLAGVEYLKSLPFVDPKRIGVFGWSYGGYMALTGLLRSDVFSMGIAVAPVTDWRWYDSAYTERYMQRPNDNPEGYNNSRLPPLAEKLKAPLLLVHGISDNNVHFIHSARMFEALTAAHKNFESIFFPGKDHKLSGPSARVHLFTRILRFIEDEL